MALQQGTGPDQVAVRTDVELLKVVSVIPLDGEAHCPMGNITDYHSTRPST